MLFFTNISPILFLFVSNFCCCCLRLCSFFPMGHLKKAFWHIKTKPCVQYIIWHFIHLKNVNGCMWGEGSIYSSSLNPGIQQFWRRTEGVNLESTRSSEARFSHQLATIEKHLYLCTIFLHYLQVMPHYLLMFHFRTLTAVIIKF